MQEQNANLMDARNSEAIMLLGTHLDLQEVADEAVGGHALREGTLRSLALLGAALELGKEVVRQRRIQRPLCLQEGTALCDMVTGWRSVPIFRI